MHSTAEKQFQRLFCHCELFWTQSSTSRAAQTVQHNKSGNVALEKYMHRTWVVASRDNVAVNKQRSAFSINKSSLHNPNKHNCLNPCHVNKNDSQKLWWWCRPPEWTWWKFFCKASKLCWRAQQMQADLHVYCVNSQAACKCLLPVLLAAEQKTISITLLCCTGYSMPIASSAHCSATHFWVRITKKVAWFVAEAS